MVNYFRAWYYLRSMMRRAYWPRNKLTKYQNEKLREIVKYAWNNVPFYHEKFREAGVKPTDIKTIEDLSKLPIIRKDDIKRNGIRMISREYDIAKLRKLRTSGSTGEPLFFYISGKEDEFRKAKHLRANIACGQRPRDKWVAITSPPYFSQATKLQRLLGIYAPVSVSVFDDVVNQISIIEKLRPDVLDGYGSSLLLLAREIEKMGIDTIKPRLLLSGADLIGPRSRHFVENVFGAPLYDQYSSAEFERLAWQCKEKNGYHIDADSVIMEFVDENGENVAPEEAGEIVCTSLFNRAMPLIRYALNDLGKASDEGLCPCGRTFPLMKVIEGRKDDVIVLPDGRAMSSLAFIVAMYDLSFYKDIEKFRVIQKRVNHFKFLIKLRNREVYNEESIKAEMVAHFSKVLMIDANEMNFDIELTNEIPLDKSGKFRIVISELKK